MRVVVGIDLGSTTTKAILLDEAGEIVGKGITNSRSNYGVACAVAHEEALTAARFSLLRRILADGSSIEALHEAFRLELYLDELAVLECEVAAILAGPTGVAWRDTLERPALLVLEAMRADAPNHFGEGKTRQSDFFRDLAGASFVAQAEHVAGDAPFERLIGLFDRAVLQVETCLRPRDFSALLGRAGRRVGGGLALDAAVAKAASEPIEEISFTGTGYGRQTLPFPKEGIRSEILCHGRGAHRVFPGTRTVLDIGGQDTKAIQVDDTGVVTSFQMNDRCAAGCGRYLGYIADELNLALHELGPLALKAKKILRVNSTCTVFAGAELRERLALGQRREDILAGLHRAIMLRAASLLARSGGIRNEFTFTGGVCKNPMATKILADLVRESYGDGITLNAHPDSIIMGALGAAMYALDDARAGKPRILPTFVPKASRACMPEGCETCTEAA